MDDLGRWVCLAGMCLRHILLPESSWGCQGESYYSMLWTPLSQWGKPNLETHYWDGRCSWLICILQHSRILTSLLSSLYSCFHSIDLIKLFLDIVSLHFLALFFWYLFASLYSFSNFYLCISFLIEVIPFLPCLPFSPFLFFSGSSLSRCL